MELEFELTENNLHIVDSWKVSKRDMLEMLTTIAVQTQKNGQVSRVWCRTMKSLRAEWVVHNALYRMGIQRERTKDVDLNVPSDKPEWLYMTASWMLWTIAK